MRTRVRNFPLDGADRCPHRRVVVEGDLGGPLSAFDVSGGGSWAVSGGKCAESVRVDQSRLEDALSQIGEVRRKASAEGKDVTNLQAARRCCRTLFELDRWPELSDALSICASRYGQAWQQGATVQDMIVLVAYPSLDRRRRSEIARVLFAVRGIEPTRAGKLVEQYGDRALGRLSLSDIAAFRKAIGVRRVLGPTPGGS